MNLKKTAALFLAVAGICSLAAQESSGNRPPGDIVLVIDTSASMFPYYNESASYLSGPFLANNLNVRDTLHIISFGVKPRLEIIRRILGRGDIETASARLWLLYPLEPSSDVSAALTFSEQYTRTLPGGRSKKVFIVSDDDISSQINAAAPRFKSSGADLSFIRVSSSMGGSGPAAGRSQGRTPAAGTSSGRQTGEGPASAGTPDSGTGNSAGQAGTGRSSADGNSVIAADGGSAGVTDFSGGIENGQNNSGEPNGSVDDPAVTTEEENGRNGNDVIQPPGGGTVFGTESRAGTSGSGFDFASLPFPLLIALALLVLAAILLIIILKTRSLHASPKKVMASSTGQTDGSAGKTDDSAARNAELLNSFATRQAAASLQGPPRPHQYRDDSGQFLTNPPMLNLFVEEQNTAIGKRNVHALKKGSSYSVGGGVADDFLIFLVPLPSRLGQLYFDGTNCTFRPLKPSYFPDLGSSPVNECIGKTIRILSDKSYEVFFHFERYKDPLIVLNQLLHSIQVPEAPNRAG